MNSITPGTPVSLPAWIWAFLTVLLPLLGGVFVQLSGAFEKHRELDIRMLELGIGIIRAAPEKGSENADREAKKWAMGVLEKFSGVAISAEAKEIVSTGSVTVVDPPSVKPIQPIGWVAVGYLNTPTGERLFGTREGTSLTAVTPGDIIKARTAVNVRQSAASWGPASAVVQANQCFAVAEVVTKDAAGLTQTWASGTVVDCTITVQ